MIRNDLTVAWRTLRRHLGATAINVVGLGVGVAASVLLLLFVRSELAVNDVFPAAERIYRIDSEWAGEDQGLPFLTPAPVGPALRQQFPEVEAQTRMYGMWAALGTAGDFYRRDALLTDPSFLEVFELPLRHGDAATALEQPRSVLLHETLARTLFGSADVVGRTVEVNTWQHGTQPYTVTGVWAALPKNSVTQIGGAQYEMIFPETGTGDFTPEASWHDWGAAPFLLHFARLGERGDVQALREKMTGFMQQNAPERLHDTLELVPNPLTAVYLSDDDQAGWKRIGLLAALAALILLMAGINFTNLATARSLDRARAVGVRKTFGAERYQLARQFLVEAVLVSLLATTLGATLAAAGADLLAQLAGVDFVLQEPWDAATLGALAALALLLGGAAGAYPAFVLSGFAPTAALRDRLSLGRSAGTLRQGLVVVQFALAIVLLAGVYVVHEQLTLATSRDLTFPSDRILTIDSAPRDFSEAGYRRIQTARARIAALPSVEAASVSWEVPSVGTGVGGSRLRRPRWPEARSVEAGTYRVGPHFAETYDLSLTAGRFFRTPITDDASSVVLNERAVRALGLDAPVGATIDVGEASRTVIGVVRDFNRQNVRTGMGPTLLSPIQPGEWFRTMSVKGAPGATHLVEDVRAAWETVLPGAPFAARFLEARIAAAYGTERQTRRLVGAGAGLALFVALLGLVGLTGFTVRRRTKEIGIRKTLGASTVSLVALLSRDVAVLVGGAFVIGGPAAYLLARWWLRGYALRIDLTPWPFLGIGLAVMLCALAIAGTHAARAARLAPAETLHNE